MSEPPARRRWAGSESVGDPEFHQLEPDRWLAQAIARLEGGCL